MKIEIKNSSVKFTKFDTVLFDEDVTFASNAWKYLDLSFPIPYRGKVKTKLTIDTSVVSSMSSAQVKPYVNSAVQNAPVLLANKYNEDAIAINYQDAFDKIGFYLNGSNVFPLTVHLKIEYIETVS